MNNKYLQRIPQYIRQYPKLINLIDLFTQYFNNTENEIKKTYNGNSLDNIDINYLQAIINRLDVDIGYTTDKDLLSSSIKGRVIDINSDATRNNIVNLFNALFAKANTQITENTMSIEIGVSNAQTTYSSILLQYLVPNITGVEVTVTFSDNNTFTFMNYVDGEEVGTDSKYKYMLYDGNEYYVNNGTYVSGIYKIELI